VWLILGGRGAGKTRAGAEWVRAKALGLAPMADAPAKRIALVGETLAEVRRVMVEGVSGLLAVHEAGERPLFEPTKLQLTWPNGTVAQMFSAGGTPSDRSVVAAIRDLKQRGLKVTLTPFILMDVAHGNALPDPYGGAAQAAYPWRGRITCHPAPGEAGSPDQTADAGLQVTAFVGTASASDFEIAGDEVSYAGPAEWSYRRMVLHLANLAVAAGGVDTFVIGSELRGLTWVRDAPGSYPFVEALQELAADVRAVVGPATKVIYAADWSEYFGHQPADGSGDVYFHLDPLWASADIDAIGIDCYWPLADWRDGRGQPTATLR